VTARWYAAPGLPGEAIDLRNCDGSFDNAPAAHRRAKALAKHGGVFRVIRITEEMSYGDLPACATEEP
jgi:hypothetical protein